MMQTDAQVEEIEGLEEDQGSFWGDYPIDTLLIRNETRTVHDVLRRIGDGRFVMNPEFQRDFIWSDAQQSKLIESVIMRIPAPGPLPCGGRRWAYGRRRWIAAAVDIQTLRGQ